MDDDFSIDDARIAVRDPLFSPFLSSHSFCPSFRWQNNGFPTFRLEKALPAPLLVLEAWHSLTMGQKHGKAVYHDASVPFINRE